MNIWRVAGFALVVGLALFLVSLLLKLLLIAGVTLLLVRVVGGRLAGRYFGALRQGNWPAPGVISIDDPTYQSRMPRRGADRIIPIN